MILNLKLLLLSLLCFIKINAQNSELLQHFGSPPYFDKKFSNSIVKIDTIYRYYGTFYKYPGTLLNFPTENIIYFREGVNYHEASKNKNAKEWLKWSWKINEYYSRDGKIIKKDLWFIKNEHLILNRNIFPNILESYFLNRNSQVEKSQNIGDPLFTSTFKEIIKVFEKNGINPLQLRESTYFRLSKIISPQGCYWEFAPITVQSEQIYVLVDDKTQKVVMQSFDSTPKEISSLRAENYLEKRKKLFDPTKNNFKLKFDGYKGDIKDIIEKIYPIHTDIVSYPILKGLWVAQVYLNKVNYDFSIIFIDDDTGEIVLNSADYEKSYLGEEDFKKDVNKLLVKYYDENR